MAETRGVAYSPGLDGLRALAVGAVVAFHADLGLARGGFLGVSVFFTLSGFLITLLLISEHQQSGRVDLRRFYARRARRLLPAAWLCVAGVLVSLPFWSTAQHASLRGDAWAALGNVANWRFAYSQASYQELLERVPSPLAHFWSLAIEEQMYLVVPMIVVVALRRGTRALGWLAGGLTVASLAAMLATSDFDLAYNGTHTRAGELMIGVLLAVAMNSERIRQVAASPTARLWIALCGTAGLVLLGIAAAVVRIGDASVTGGGLTVLSIASCAVIAMVWTDAPVARWLSARPLVAIGRVSYGIYLFHWPVFVLLTTERTGLNGFVLLALRLAVVAVITSTSYALLERPIRSATVLARPSRGILLGAAVALSLVAAVAVLPVRQPDESDQLFAAGASGVIAFDDASLPALDPITQAEAAPPQSSAPSASSAGSASPASASQSAPYSTLQTDPQPTLPPARPKILVLGSDPSAVDALAGVDADIVDGVDQACPFAAGVEARVPSGGLLDISTCPVPAERAALFLLDDVPDLVVISLGELDDGLIRQADQSGYPRDGDLLAWEERADESVAQAVAAVDVFAEQDIPVVFAWWRGAGFMYELVERVVISEVGVVGSVLDSAALTSLVEDELVTLAPSQADDAALAERTRLLVVGDSTSLFMSRALHDGSPELDVLWAGHNACPFVRSTAIRWWADESPTTLECPDFAVKLPPLIESFRPDVVLVMVGPPEQLEQFYPGDDAGHFPGSAGYQEFHDAEMAEFLTLFDRSVSVLVANSPAVLDGRFTNAEMRDPAGLAGWNTQIDRWIASDPQVSSFDFVGPLEAYEAVNGSIRDDGVHADLADLTTLAADSYVEQIVAAAAAVR